MAKKGENLRSFIIWVVLENKLHARVTSVIQIKNQASEM